MVGDVVRHIVGHVQLEQLRLTLDDGHPGLEVRRLDVGGQAPLEPGAQTLLQTLDLLGGAVAGNDDLLARVVQRVEGVEKLLLRALLACQELDVVDEQHIRQTVFLPEQLGGAVFHRLDDLVGEYLAVHIDDVEIRVVFRHLELDGVEQVGLAQAGGAVDEQRVVGAGGVGRHRLRRRKGELVGRAADEVLKGEGVLPHRQALLPVLAGFLLLRVGLGDGELHLHVKAQRGFEGGLHQPGVPVL